MELTKFNKNNSVSELLDNFFGRGINDFLQEQNGTVPSVNIYEGDDHFHIEVAAPGFNKDDFDVRIDNQMLIISADKKESSEKEGEKDFKRREFTYTSFRRSFFLPETVNQDKIEAKYRNGILKLQFPKKEKSKPAKTITIT